MRLILFTLISVFGLTVGLLDLREELKQYKDQYLRAATAKINQTCPNNDDEINETIKQVETCTDKITTFDTKTMCDIIETHFTECTKPLSQLFTDCAPENAKQTPEFVFHSVVRMFKHVCDMDGEHILELINPCFWFGIDTDDSKCMQEVQKKYNSYKKKLPSKSQLCGLLEELKECAGEPLKKACHNPITRESFGGIVNAIYDECN
ncbi:uncharacterized protein LOC109597118 [Aethina tumida]|uniref:uncharacterized protein LOC109597118 n=1 Tax=Aethina tumida TaxID=116153 RepID=UPI00096B452C|nr:uncharacterized protein LOC109597118 [Aethina tumida]